MERRQIEKVKEIIKIKHEINKLEHEKKKVKKINNTKSWYFEKIGKMHSIARLTQEKRRRHKCQRKYQK